MVNQEILGGLRTALDRGEPLQKAMMTFYNAGYQKEQIEEAARYINENPVAVQPVSVSKMPEVPKPKSGLFQKKEIPQTQMPSVPSAPSIPQNQPIVSNYGTEMPAKTGQASNYGTEKKSDKTMIVILITILVLLFGLLASIFLFKNEIINFFSNALG